MNVTQFSFVLLPLCLLWIAAPAKLLQLVVIAGVFEAAAALTIGSVGLQPGLVPALTFIGYMSLQTLLGARFAGATEAIRDTRPFVLITMYALLSSYIMPRLFEGVVFVWPQKVEPPFILTPLAPSLSNLNQDLYLFINCVFLVFAAIFMTKSNLKLISFIRSYLYSGIVVSGLAVWQFANKIAGVPYPEGLLYSNPGWSILTSQTIGSIPRINGPMAEPSSLGSYMGAIVCATGWLLLQGHRDRILLRLFVIGLGTIILSTSSTGFAVLGLLGVGVPAYALMSGSTRLISGIVRISLPLLILIGIIYSGASTLSPDFNKNVAQVVNATLDKRQSDSYEDRTSTDVDSLQVVVDSYGLGAGWGSNRSSSIVPGLLASMGIPGCVGLLWFGTNITQRVRRARRARCSKEQMFVIDGCCGAIVGFLLAAGISGPTISGITFYFLLALLIACTIRVEIQNRRSSPTRIDGAISVGFGPVALQSTGANLTLGALDGQLR